MKKILILSLLSTFCLISNGQNKVGGYIMASNTAIHNSANRQGDPIYKHKLTYSGGAGAYYTHFLSKKHGGKNKFHGGRMMSMTRNRWAIRAGVMYSSHNQKFKSDYKVQGEVKHHEGKKRLRILKAGAYIEHSYPLFHSKKLNFIWFFGPQVAYMYSQKGGIVTWRHHEDTDYYDLPPDSKEYFKTFSLEFAGALGLEYHLTRWTNLTLTAYADWSATTIENNDTDVWNDDPNWSDKEVAGVYDRFESRKDSRLSTHALLIGAEFTFHRAEHARAKF